MRQSVDATVARLQEMLRVHGCKTTRLCFAMQSTSLSGLSSFKLQKTFVLRSAEVLFKEHDTQVSAVQYGSISKLLSSPTKDENKFSNSIRRSVFDPAVSSSLRDPIVACDTLLYDGGTSKGLIVLLGDGTHNFGGDPVYAADNFRSRGGHIFGVMIGEKASAAGRRRVEGIVGSLGSPVVTIETSRQIQFALCQLVSSAC